MVLEETLKALLDKVQIISKSETVVGEPKKIGETIIIPISRVRIGFGVGTHGRGETTEKAKSEGGLTGGGILVDPVAILYIDEKGKAQMFLITSEKFPALARIVDVLPDAIERLMGRRKTQEKEK